MSDDFERSQKKPHKLPSDPRVLAAMLEVHSVKMARLRQIQAAKMRAVNARKNAVAHAKQVVELAHQVARQVAAVKAARAATALKHAVGLHSQVHITAR